MALLFANSELGARSEGGGFVFAFANGDDVWIRRPAADANTPISIEVYTARGEDRLNADHHHVRVAPSPASSSDATVRDAFAQAAAGYFESRSSGAFDTYAAARIQERYGNKTAKPNAGPLRSRSERDDIGRLMDTTTGMTSIQETRCRSIARCGCGRSRRSRRSRSRA